MSGHVLEEANFWLDLEEDSVYVWPEVSGIVGSESVTGDRKRLAGVPSRDDIHSSTVEIAREGRDIVPDRSAIQALVFHPCHENGRCEGFPLTVTHGCVTVSEGELESKLESSNPGT